MKRSRLVVAKGITVGFENIFCDYEVNYQLGKIMCCLLLEEKFYVFLFLLFHLDYWEWAYLYRYSRYIYHSSK